MVQTVNEEASASLAKSLTISEGSDLELQKWEAERDYRNREIAIKEREQACREGELALKREEYARAYSKAINWSIVIPALAAITAALIALLSNIYATFLNGANQIAQEKQHFRANLILESVKTGDRAKAIANLQFFLDAGFINDPEGKITSLIKSNKYPVLPVAPNVPMGSKCVVRLPDGSINVRDMGEPYPVGSVCTNADPSGGRDWGTVQESIK
jgi:hypothetical protein